MTDVRTFTPNANGAVLWDFTCTAGTTFSETWLFERWGTANAASLGARNFTGYTAFTLSLSWTEGGADLVAGSGLTSPAVVEIVGAADAGTVSVRLTSAFTSYLQTNAQAGSGWKKGFGALRGTDSAGDVIDLEVGEFFVRWTPVAA